jgi:predicted glycoside hydrolase/deacetylase ChbG (UPF0249 family)
MKNNCWENDPYPLEENMIEAGNQIKRFIDLAGKKPGYINEDLFCCSNDTVFRTKDLDMACSPKLRAFIEKNDVELFNYDDLK